MKWNKSLDALKEVFYDDSMDAFKEAIVNRTRKSTITPSRSWVKYTKRQPYAPMYGRLYHYAGNNPIRYIDPDGNLVVAVAGVEQVGCGTGESGAGGVFLCWGKDGFSFGFYATASAGAFFGAAASGGVEVTFAFFADEFADIEGYSLSAGGSAKFGPSGSLGVELGFNPKAKTVKEKIQSSTITFSYTWGTSPLPEGHIYNNYTFKLLEYYVGDSQKSNEINKNVMEYYNNDDYEGLHKYVQEVTKELLNENN